MNLDFELMVRNSEEVGLVNSFCDELKESFTFDVRENINPVKLQTLEKPFLQSKLIDWENTPVSLNMSQIAYDSINLIDIKNVKDYRFSLYLRTDIRMPNTNTSLEKAVRILEFGTEEFKGAFYLTPVFLKYRAKIKDYWKAYVAVRLKRLPVSEIITFK